MRPRKQNFLRARYARLEHVDRDVIGQMKAFSCVLDALCAHIALCVHSGARGTAAATPSTHDYIRAIGTSARLRKRLTILAILGIWGVCSSKTVPGTVLEILRFCAVSLPILALGVDYAAIHPGVPSHFTLGWLTTLMLTTIVKGHLPSIQVWSA